MRSAVGSIKQNTGRVRPNGQDRVSFPSGHASGSALSATLAYRNMERLSSAYPAADTASRMVFTGFAAATGWARVEAKQHYPSDVLAGAAIGHFFGAFISELVLDPVSPARVVPVIEPSPDGFFASLTLRF
jgi:membrane-associated phospholipid phosphatase